LPKDCAFVLLDPGKARALADSAFNERRHECNMALTAVRNIVPTVQDLSDLDCTDLQEVAPHLKEPLQSRVRHIVTENERVRNAVQAIQEHDLRALCQTMYESHRSLSENYQTSAPELDAIVGALKRSGLPVGAKLCGAGFGGAVVCCVIRPDTALLRKVGSVASDSVGAPVVLTPVRVAGSARLIPSRS
jgi:galactokinase